MAMDKELLTIGRIERQLHGLTFQAQERILRLVQDRLREKAGVEAREKLYESLSGAAMAQSRPLAE